MSWQNWILTRVLRRWVKPDTIRDTDIATTRALTARVPFRAKLPPGWRIRPGTGAAFKGEWIEPIAPDHTARTRSILYLHGGAYVAMSPHTHRAITSRLAVGSDATLFALDYRLAPEHPFPAALEDALKAWHALIAAGASASRMVVAGDSAGGGLALALILALRDANEPTPAGVVVLSPWTDLAATGNSIIDNDANDALMFGRWVAAEARHYLGKTPATHPLASPFYADLSGLPPLLIHVGDSEVLLDDSRRLHEKALRSGVASTLRIWHDVPHGWQMFATILPEARASLREAGLFIRDRWPPTAPTASSAV